MGPRFDERGKGGELPTACGAGGLQWGRASMSAERYFSTPLTEAPLPLQWGRASMSAESGGLRSRPRTMQGASMGPQCFDERGKPAPLFTPGVAAA